MKVQQLLEGSEEPVRKTVKFANKEAWDAWVKKFNNTLTRGDELIEWQKSPGIVAVPWGGPHMPSWFPESRKLAAGSFDKKTKTGTGFEPASYIAWRKWVNRNWNKWAKANKLPLDEAHFDDPEFDMQTHDDDKEIMDWCKKNAVKVEKKGAKNLVRFSGPREALRQMIHQFWGQPADYTSAIREASMKNLLIDFEEYYLDNDGSSWGDEKLGAQVSTFLKKKGLPADLQASLIKAAKTFGSK